jgi:NRPS condensation-like uncharacterized protein
MVLPLPLAPFEHYMLADDRPAYPMNIVLRLRFSGRLDRTMLESALATALARHPLLTAVVRRCGRRWIWTAAERLAAIRWLDVPPAEALPELAPLDVRVAPGIQLSVCERPRQVDLVLQVHHACCDGLAVATFVEDLLTAYAIEHGAATICLRPLQPEQLARRRRLGMGVRRFGPGLPHPLAALRGAREFLGRASEPLVPHQTQATDGRPRTGYPAALTRRLDEVQTAHLLATAKALGVTLNDLLAREVFFSLVWWRQRHAPGRTDGWLRLCLPISLRTPAHDRLPAANVVSMVFLDRRDADLRDAGRLLTSIHDQMQLIKRLGLAPTFVRSLGWRQWLPGSLERVCQTPRCLATAVFTNVGILFQRCPLADGQGRVTAGDLVLENMDWLAPLRPLTCAALAAWTYARRLRFTLHYDPHVLTAPQAGELIENLVARVRRSIAIREPLAAGTP